MAKKPYDWTENSIPKISAHSLAKHRILREYVQKYLEVLTTTPGMEVFRINLIDGFAGGGHYQDAQNSKLIHLGSPHILIDAVRAAEVKINSTRNKPLRIDASFVFVEKDPVTLKCLTHTLQQRTDIPKDNFPQILAGAFDENLDAIIKHIKSRGTAHRAIFVLDQYGYTGVPLTTLTRIFNELPNAEIFLTLAVGWITAYLPNATTAAQKLGLSAEMIEKLSKNPDQELDLSDPEQRPTLAAIQRILHHAFTSEVGSRFFTPFFIVSRESNRPYWFLHMANSARANDVVKTLHWEVENHFEHFGRSGLVMLGYDPNEDPEVTKQSVFQFDNQAKIQTEKSLLDDLAKRVSETHSDGVIFNTLFQETCNETPATKKLIQEAISKLCVEGELEKVGANGERRFTTTLPHDDDLIKLPSQTVFSFST